MDRTSDYATAAVVHVAYVNNMKAHEWGFCQYFVNMLDLFGQFRVQFWAARPSAASTHFASLLQFVTTADSSTASAPCLNNLIIL